MQLERNLMILALLENREKVEKPPKPKGVSDHVPGYFNIRKFVCLMYGYPEWGVVSVHHIDVDRENNDFENLIPLSKIEHTRLSGNNAFKKTVESAVFTSITRAWIRGAVEHEWNMKATMERMEV